MSPCKSQSEILQELHNLQDKQRLAAERIKYILRIDGRSFVEDYCNGKLSLILDVRAEWDGDIIRGRLESSTSETLSGRLPSFIFHVNAVDARIADDWNQEPMLIKLVEGVHSPNGSIPSVVRLYLGHDAPEQIGTGRVYFSPFKRAFKVVSGRVDREFGKLAHSLRNESFNGSKPSVIEGTFQIMDNVANHQGEVAGNLSISNVMLDNFISAIGIYLDARSVGIRQRSDSRLNIRDVLIGPFDLGPSVSKQACHAA